MNLAARWNRYWFRPNYLIHLAILRILVVGFQLGYITKNDTGYFFERFERLAQLPDALYRPLPILRLFIWPLGWEPNWYRPSFEVLLVVYWLTMIFGLLALIGFKTNLSLVGFTIGNIFMQAFIYSFVEFHHPEGLLTMTLIVLTLSPSGAVLSVDDLRRRLRLNAVRGKFEPFNILEEKSIFATWPILLIQYMYALIYMSAAVSKLAAKGFDWVNGYTLQFYLISDGLRKGSDLAVWLGQYHSVAWLMSVFTIFFEGTFFLVLIFPALAWLYVPMGMGLHLGIYFLMKAPFFQFIIIYAVFVSWVPLIKKLAHRLRFPRSKTGPVVIYDNRSPGQVRSMTILRYFDWLNRLSFNGINEEGQTTQTQQAETSAEETSGGFQVLLPNGTVESGFLAFRRVLSYLPLFWPLGFIFYFPIVSMFGLKLYSGLLGSGN